MHEPSSDGPAPGDAERLLPRPAPRGPRRRLSDHLARAAVRTVVRTAIGDRVRLLEGGAGPETRPDGAITVRVHDPAAYRAVLRGGSVGLGRSYAAGWWDTDDVVGLLRLATAALPQPDGPWGRFAGWLGRVRGERSSTGADLEGDRGHIRAHYDLGDDFFSCFLDPTLTYSCGIFDSPGATMEQASVTKLDRICTKLSLGPTDEVLEIGTGWGSFALHAAGRYGCRVVTTTISDRQFAFAQKRVAEAGLQHLVTVRNDDYRHLTGTYDKVVSIEMIEAVGWRQLDRYFEVCAERLRPDGAMALQAIVIDDRLYERAKRSEDFIKAMVFPGSTIPSLAAITRSLDRTDLRIVGREDIGQHYVETLARWRSALLENRSRIAALGYDAEFLRLWDLYLAYCEAGFAEGRIGDVQLVLAKPRWRPDGEG